MVNRPFGDGVVLAGVLARVINTVGDDRPGSSTWLDDQYDHG
ncbi:hypothetical protein [Halomonas rhizosphaerae]|uniref:Uncharacterized protein n=1 Tax=Halomonas rhizosphaerae TaxID=3043296 RepID=A0ABT6V0V4_9GAMM|nr:hypothetical protein [Halomonas rhizosphaerae]MDI5891863.1 hypothetical protein [Halomonas rhizosphaerae]